MNAIKLSNYTVKYVFLAIVSIVSSLFFIDCTAISDQINELTYSYDEVKIGNQVWMDKNLNVDHFRNGDPIPQAKTKEEWTYAIENKEPAWCYYDNNSSNGSKYGKLYNWYAVIDKRGLAPEGWHVSTDEDWRTLNKYLGGHEGKAAHKLKSKTDWKDDDFSSGIGASTRNSTGFSGLPGGACSSDFDFDHLNEIGRFWTCTEKNIDGIIIPDGSITYSLHNSSPGSVEGDLIGWSGLSVRCVKGNLPKTINNNPSETYEIVEDQQEYSDEIPLNSDETGDYIEDGYDSQENSTYTEENTIRSRDLNNGIYPQASSRLINPNELISMRKEDLKIMRNEIFARHGYIFKTAEMKSYFNNQNWYVPSYENVTNLLSEIEKKNITLIKYYEE